MKKLPANATRDRGATGGAAQIERVKEGFAARLEEAKFKKPKHMSFGHDSNIAKHIVDGTSEQEYRFVLIDYRNENEQIKSKMMTHKEAADRNRVLSGTGLAWAKTYR